MLFVHATLGQQVPSSDVMLVPSEDLEDFRHRSSLNDGCYLFQARHRVCIWSNIF